jgi:hypothetical protein
MVYDGTATIGTESGASELPFTRAVYGVTS